MLTRFNNWLANKLSGWLSTMAMFYGISFLVLAPLFFQRPDNMIGWVQYAVQSFFQGVALPVLAFVAKIEGGKQAKILQETHDAVMEELAMVREALGLAAEERDELKAIIKSLNIECEPSIKG